MNYTPEYIVWLDGSFFFFYFGWRVVPWLHRIQIEENKTHSDCVFVTVQTEPKEKWINFFHRRNNNKREKKTNVEYDEPATKNYCTWISSCPEVNGLWALSSCATQYQWTHALNIADVGAEIWRYFQHSLFRWFFVCLIYFLESQAKKWNTHNSEFIFQSSVWKLISDWEKWMREREKKRAIFVVASVRLHDSWGKRLIYFRHDLLILYLLFPLVLCLCFRSAKKKRIRFASAWEKYINRNKCKWACVNV